MPAASIGVLSGSLPGCQVNSSMYAIHAAVRDVGMAGQRTSSGCVWRGAGLAAPASRIVLIISGIVLCAGKSAHAAGNIYGATPRKPSEIGE